MATRTRKTKTTAGTAVAPPPLREAVTLTTDEMTKAQAWFEDKIVRAVRKKGYCAEALKIMAEVFGEPLDTAGVIDVAGAHPGTFRTGDVAVTYLDSEGFDCWGNTWRDDKGFDRNGLDKDGRDRDGFDKDGRDIAGFDRDGKDKDGISKDDPARFKWDLNGFDAEGYNRDGYNAQGWNREGKNSRGETRPDVLYAFDRDGYDAEGWNFSGYNRDGGYSEDVYRKYRQARGLRH